MSADTAAVLAAIERVRMYAADLAADDWEQYAQDSLALADVAEAAARWTTNRRWWRGVDAANQPYCKGCGAIQGMYGDEVHAPDCPALALDARLTRLAEVAP